MASFSNLTIGIALASFTIFQLLFHVLSSWVSTRITPGFSNLSQKRKIEWNSRTVSTFHALVVGGFCLYILLYDEAVNADHLWFTFVGQGMSLALLNWYFDISFITFWNSPSGRGHVTPKEGDPSIVKLNIAITTGYLISDLLLIICYWKAIGDKFFVIHHLAALYAYYFVLSKGLLAYFGNFRLLAEFSTPFVNQRWFFEVLGYPKSSKANMINGVLMTVVFFVVRIAVMPMYYSRVFSSFGTEGFQRLGFAAQSAWIISSVVLDVMNLMWMVKITKGCYKVICLVGQEEAKTHKNGKSD